MKKKKIKKRTEEEKTKKKKKRIPIQLLDFMCLEGDRVLV